MRADVPEPPQQGDGPVPGAIAFGPADDSDYLTLTLTFATCVVGRPFVFNAILN
jgi:hypothetical protein